MRIRRLEALTLACVLPLGAVGCEEEPEVEVHEVETVETEAPEATAPTMNPATLLANAVARLGGTKMVAGNNLVVELLPRADGQVSGVVYDAEGNLVSDAKLSVTVKGADGQDKNVDLQWDADASQYLGSVQGSAEAGADVIASGPVRVSVEHEDAEVTGETALMVAPVPHYGGEVLVAGNIAAEVVALPSGAIQVMAFGPQGALTGDTTSNMKVAVPDASGVSHDVNLVWNADASAFLGSVEEGVSLGSGPLVFTVFDNGVEHSTRIAASPIRAPQHEGDVVVVGDMSVEIVPQAGNKVYLYAVGPDGAGFDGDANAEINLAFGGAVDPIPATWDASADAYVATVPPSVDVSATPMRVQVRRNNRWHRGAIAAPAGRALGVAWRSRIESGAGGAIPPGQASVVLAGPDIRQRAQANLRADGAAQVGVPGVRVGHGTMAGVNVRGAGARANGVAVMAGANVRGASNSATGAAVMAGADVRAAGAAGANRAQAGVDAVRGARVEVRAPMVAVPMVSVMAGAGATGGGSTTATTRRRETGASTGGSAMAGFMVGFGN